MSESKAVFYLRVPNDLQGLAAREGKPVPLPYAAFFVQFQLPRLPNGTPAENAIVRRLIGMLGNCQAGDEHELHAAEGDALKKSLPQLADQKLPPIDAAVFMQTQDFYAAVFGMPPEKPADWGTKPEPLPLEEAAQ